jgi:hypothetical protein
MRRSTICRFGMPIFATPPDGANCTVQQLMTAPPGCAAQTNMPTFYVPPGNGVSGGQMTAKQMLTLANHIIHKFTSLPASGLPVGHCIDKSLVPRGAFQGDPVCVTQKEANDVTTDNNNAAAGKTYLSSSNFTDKTFYNGDIFVPNVPNNIVPYGICASGLQYRQAYMGDYVCVTKTQAKQVKADNEEGPPLLPE